MTGKDTRGLILLGAGGHAKVLAALVKATGGSILGIVDPALEAGSEYIGLPVLGDDEHLSDYSSSQYLLVNGIGSLPDKPLRWKLAQRMRQQGFSFATLVHPTAIVGEDVHMDGGVQVMAGAIVQPGTQLGRDCIVNTGAIIDHDCQIGDNCHLAPGITLSGEVNIGPGTHIGTGASVINGISIGANTMVAAGSVVYKDLPPGSRMIP